MARATVETPVSVARKASAIMGRTVTDKQVREVARQTLADHDKVKHPAYTSHEYSAADVKRLLAVFTARKGKGKATSRKATSKAATVTRKRSRAVKATAQTAETPDA